MASGRAETGATHVTFAILSVNRADQASIAAAGSDETPTRLDGPSGRRSGRAEEGRGQHQAHEIERALQPPRRRRRPRFRFLSYCRCRPSHPLGPWPGWCWKRRCSFQRSLEAVLDAMQERLDRAPKTMRIRRQTTEHPFGTIKAWMGATHFRLPPLKRSARR
jgi:hypothetical protein